MQSYNLQAGSGITTSFEEVLFLDGTDPASHPVSQNFQPSLLLMLKDFSCFKHDLPPLSNAAVVEALNSQQSRDYYRGYYGVGGNLPAIDDRKQLILRAIGCR